jgi:hypothetical protein
MFWFEPVIRLTTSKSPSATVPPPAGAIGATVTATAGVLVSTGGTVAIGAGEVVAVGAAGTAVAAGAAFAVSGSRVVGIAVADSCAVAVAVLSAGVTVESSALGSAGSTTGAVVANGDDRVVSGGRRTGGSASGGVVATGPEATCALSGAEEQLVIKSNATAHAALSRYFALTAINRSSSNLRRHRDKNEPRQGAAKERHHADQRVPRSPR